VIELANRSSTGAGVSLSHPGMDSESDQHDGESQPELESVRRSDTATKVGAATASARIAAGQHQNQHPDKGTGRHRDQGIGLSTRRSR